MNAIDGHEVGADGRIGRGSAWNPIGFDSLPGVSWLVVSGIPCDGGAVRADSWDASLVSKFTIEGGGREALGDGLRSPHMSQFVTSLSLLKVHWTQSQTSSVLTLSVLGRGVAHSSHTARVSTLVAVPKQEEIISQ